MLHSFIFYCVTHNPDDQLFEKCEIGTRYRADGGIVDSILVLVIQWAGNYKSSGGLVERWSLTLPCMFRNGWKPLNGQ